MDTEARGAAPESNDKPALVAQLTELIRAPTATAVQEQASKAARQEEAAQLAGSLLRPLTDEEQKIVHSALHSQHGRATDVLATIGTHSVQRRSMHTLKPDIWMNDEVINCFYTMLAKRDKELCTSDPEQKRSHFFGSSFMSALLNEGHANEGLYEYRNVKRFSRRVPGKDIFKLDKIFFPINVDRMHWVCAMIDMTKKKIYVYDSMASNGIKFLESLFQYIQDEHQNIKGVPLPDIDEWELVDRRPGTPCQRNGMWFSLVQRSFSSTVSNRVSIFLKALTAVSSHACLLTFYPAICRSYSHKSTFRNAATTLLSQL